MERELKRVKNGRLLLIPASDATTGHGTTASGQVVRQGVAGAAADRPEAVDVASV